MTEIRSINVLLAEDEPDIRTSAMLMLQHSGFAVKPAASGTQALKIAEETESAIDVLVTDYRLPDLDGITLAKYCRVIHSGMAVVIMSGLLSQEIEVPGDLSDAIVLEKPFDSRTLCATVRSVAHGCA